MTIIDLTLEIYDGLKSYLSHPPIVIRPESTFENSGHRYVQPCEGFESRFLEMSDHSGTHIDAPLHFIRGGASTAEMQLDRCVGQAVCIDVTPYKGKQDEVTYDMLEEAVKAQGLTIEPNSIVLVRTRTGEWGDEGFFQEGAFHESVGDWLIEKQVKCVGLDLANIDTHDNMARSVHMKILPKNIYIVENLVNLQSLPLDRPFEFIALPLKLKNSTASPVRAIAKI